MSAGHPYARGEGWDTLVLGIGNLLYADEGFGVRALETLNERYVFGDDVRVMDGGTQGIFLLPWVRSATRLLIFDAIDFGLPPATLRLIEGNDVPCFMGAKKVSMHQAGFQEVLSSAQLSGEFPGRLALVGVQPAVLDDYGGSLSADIKAQLTPAVELAIGVLERWGVRAARRAGPAERGDLTGPDALAICDYEQGRPRFGGGRR